MAYDWKKDWEQTKKTLVHIEQGWRDNAACQIWNKEMAELVNQYKQEEMVWYNSPQLTENGFQTTTQNLWYAHYLNKKRLCTLGLTARYDYIQPTAYTRGENQRFPYWTYSHDGKNLICRLGDSMNYRKSFFVQNRLVWSDEEKGLPGVYYIIRSQSMNGRYVCPSCGREDTLESFVDGCDYCGTKFRIESLKQKVSSVYNPQSRTRERSGFTLKKNFGPMYVVLVILVMGSMVYASNAGAGIMRVMPIIGILMIVAFLAILLGKTSKESIKEGPARTRQILERIRGVDAHFSEEAFIGNLMNKLMSVCYASSMAEVKPFVTCDVTPFMETYSGTIDCKLLECVLLQYYTGGGYQRLEVKVRLGLTIYGNGKIYKVEPPLKLRLVKSMNALTKSISDVNVYRCASCGASLSLLNGGRCEHCGSVPDLKEYDWVIEDFGPYQE